jgi:hypothetical protein
MTGKTPRHCEVSLQSTTCEAPAGYRTYSGWAPGDTSCRCACYQCGGACCKECSTIKNGRRICTDCASENKRFAKKETACSSSN